MFVLYLIIFPIIVSRFTKNYILVVASPYIALFITFFLIILISKRKTKIRRRKWSSGSVNAKLRDYKYVEWGQRIDGKSNSNINIEGGVKYGRLCPNCNSKLEINTSCSYCGWAVKENEQRSRRIPKAVQREVWRRDKGRCAECGSREKLEYDHIIPFSKGGSNTVRNVELLCEKCNRSKHNKI